MLCLTYGRVWCKALYALVVLPKALEFIQKYFAGTNALVPQEFSSDMSNADMGSFGEENMKVVNEITAEMKEVKEEKLNDLISGMVDISEEGLDAFGIVETLDQIGNIL